jgi:hypothetical protein
MSEPTRIGCRLANSFHLLLTTRTFHSAARMVEAPIVPQSSPAAADSLSSGVIDDA